MRDPPGQGRRLNDVLIRQFMKSFAITRFQAGLVQSAFYMGYFVLAMPAALIMRKLGYKAGFVIGLFLFGLGTFLFWPAAMAGRYVFFLLALFVIASGLSFLETASNPFIAQMGDPGKFGETAQLFAGIQSSGLDHRRSDRHGIHLLRRGIELAASGFHEVAASL